MSGTNNSYFQWVDDDLEEHLEKLTFSKMYDVPERYSSSSDYEEDEENEEDEEDDGTTTKEGKNFCSSLPVYLLDYYFSAGDTSEKDKRRKFLMQNTRRNYRGFASMRLTHSNSKNKYLSRHIVTPKRRKKMRKILNKTKRIMTLRSE